jgi:hypothetical protein
MAYKYSVVMFKPDVVAGELVNIGIELHDMETMILHKRYTKNLDEINRRYAHGHKGVKYMHELMLSGHGGVPEVQQDRDYLLKLSQQVDTSGYKRMFYGQPNGGITSEGKWKDIDTHMKSIYDLYILIDKSEK